MSVHSTPQPGNATPVKKVTSVAVRELKGQRKVSVITAYDYPSAMMVDAAGVDCVLVGDSLGMVMLGRSDTLSVTLDEMIHHTRCVVAGVSRALVITDMPFMTYENGVDSALENASDLVRRSGVRAVKIEGGVNIAPQVKALVDAGIPVMGHIGLTPQRAAVLGGFKVQGKTAAAAEAMLEDALAIQEAGCFSMVLEAVPAPVAELITDKVSVPTIGIGAGPGCDGQVLVLHDMLGMTTGHVPRFVKQFANLESIGRAAVAKYVREVEAGTFPGPEHCFSMPEAELRAMGKLEK